MADNTGWRRLPTLPVWAPSGALAIVLAFAWLNFLTTARWAGEPGSLHGWKEPWYALALAAATVLAILTRSRIGRPIRMPPAMSTAILATGATLLVFTLFSRLPLSSWTRIPFKDDWTELYQQAVNGVALLRTGRVVGWNWWFLGGYPTSTDIAQNLGVLAFVPMAMFGHQLGYHVLHAILFLAVPALVWWDLNDEDRTTRRLATGFAALFATGYFGTIGSSGDTNSLAGVACAGLAMVGAHAARRGRAWGGPLMVLGLTLALYTHAAFFVYAAIYLALEAAWFRDRTAAVRLIAAAAFSGLAALPIHWESFRYHAYVSFNNTVYEPGAPINWPAVARNIYYNVEILWLPHRWFNDYRSLANVWLPALAIVALTPARPRLAFYAAAALLTQLLLRFNTPSVGAMFDRIQHMLPLLTAPALAGFVLERAGTLRLATALVAVIALYVQVSLAPVRHVPDLRAFDPALMDRIVASDGMVLVEVSPHRDMDSSRSRRTPTTPFDVHFEGLLPNLAGQRFYSQMIDGWVWNVFRGQVVGAGTFAGRALAETPASTFAHEMCRWGVRHLFVWTDATRAYLTRSGLFREVWRGGRWSHFVLPDGDVRSVVTRNGSGRLQNLWLVGGDVALNDVRHGDLVIVRTNYYPAWRAEVDDRTLPLRAVGGQLAFDAPHDGTYIVRLRYPSYRWLSVLAIASFIAGAWCLARRPRR
jgi:hypothetical protein